MTVKIKPTKNKYSTLTTEIRKLVEQARHNITRSINTELLFTYWHIGKLIVTKEKIEQYDDVSLREMFIDLSKELTRELGKGFSRSNLFTMRTFYMRFHLEPTVQTLSGQKIKLQKSKSIAKKNTAVQTVSGQSNKKSKVDAKAIQLKVSSQLSWSHYCELLKCNDDLETSFYQQSIINEGWSVRELRRQMDSALFERIALSKNARGVLQLAKKGKIIEKYTDIAHDSYVLEFLNIPENRRYNEKQLEQKIIDNLQKFILEMGKGFTFVGRQFRITLDNTNFYVDLVFYHRILKCFVLIDLKVKSFKHEDVGQMNLYLNYFETEQNVEGDNKPIGIILTKQKDNIIVEYATKGISNKIFVSKYQLYLPDKKLLQQRVKKILDDE